MQSASSGGDHCSKLPNQMALQSASALAANPPLYPKAGTRTSSSRGCCPRSSQRKRTTAVHANPTQKKSIRRGTVPFGENRHQQPTPQSRPDVGAPHKTKTGVVWTHDSLRPPPKAAITKCEALSVVQTAPPLDTLIDSAAHRNLAAQASRPAPPS